MTDTNRLPERLRKAITEIRRKPYPISDLIPLLSAAADALQARAQVQGEPVGWPLTARVWKRESTQEWVLEIAGTLGDTDMNIRHTQPLSVAYEDVPGLPTIYTHQAPERVPMTDEEATAMIRETVRGNAIRREGSTSLQIVRATEAYYGITAPARRGRHENRPQIA